MFGNVLVFLVCFWVGMLVLSLVSLLHALCCRWSAFACFGRAGARASARGRARPTGRAGAGAPSAFVGDLSSFLNDQTDRRWLVTVSRDGGAPTLSEQANAEAEAVRSAVMMNPLVKSVLDTFPGAIIAEVRSFAATVSDADEAGIDSTGTDDEDSGGADPGS